MNMLNKKELADLKRKYKNDQTLERYWTQFKNLYSRNLPTGVDKVAGEKYPRFDSATQKRAIAISNKIANYIEKNYSRLYK